MYGLAVEELENQVTIMGIYSNSYGFPNMASEIKFPNSNPVEGVWVSGFLGCAPSSKAASLSDRGFYRGLL